MTRHSGNNIGHERFKNISEFTKLLDDITSQGIDSQDTASQISIDTECPIENITPDWLAQMEILAPFGSKNPEPLLYAHNVKTSSLMVVGNNHLKMWLKSNGTSYDSIWFNMGRYLTDLTGANLDIVFTPQFNNWNGSPDIQLKIKDVNILS